LPNASAQFFTEIFPIKADALQALTAYRMVLEAPVDSAGERKIANKLCAQLRQTYDGLWIFQQGMILTDAPQSPIKLVMAIDAARRDHAKLLQPLGGLEEVYDWKPSPALIADVVVRHKVTPLSGDIQAALEKTTFAIPNCSIERAHKVRAWEIDHLPALSIAVTSRLIYQSSLHAYAQTLPNIADCIGLAVAEPYTQTSGEIVKVIGTLDESREKLIAHFNDDQITTLLRGTPDDHLVVRVLTAQGETDYADSMLSIIVRLEDAERLHVKPQQIETALHFAPLHRANVIKVASDVLKAHSLIGDAFSTKNHPHLFDQHAQKFNFTFAQHKVKPFDLARLSADFEQLGAAKRRTSPDKPIRITYINALGDEIDDFMEALRRHAEKNFACAISLVRERKLRVASQVNLESAVRLLAKDQPDVMLVFLPDAANSDEDSVFSDHTVLSQTVGRGLPCLIVRETTVNMTEAMTAVLMGIMARAGDTPYVLEEPLPYADRVIGLSLIEQTRKNDEHLTAIARIYRNDGMLLRWVIAENPHGGLTDAMLARLLPADLLKRKRAIVHHDGRFPRQFARALGGWEDEIDGSLYPVSIYRRGIPRLYALENRQLVPPPYGTLLRASEREAFVYTSAEGEAGASPLFVSCEPPLSIEHAVHSVLIFTHFQFNALGLSRLPISLHHDDLIESSVLRGVMPTEREGDIPFWL
jgi:hypothetical protein